MPDEMVARSISEIAAAAERQEAQLAKEIFIEDDCVVFACAGRTFVELKRVRTYGRLLAWVYHLAEKPWMTPPRLKFFIRLVGDHYNLKIRRSL